MFKQLTLPNYIFERMIGFSLPKRDKIIVISYEGIHELVLGAPVMVTHDTLHPEGGTLYDSQSRILSYDNDKFKIIGLHGGEPILQSNTGEKIHLDKQKQILRIVQNDSKVLLNFSYEDLSGDWNYATFSEDFKYVFLAIPYNLFIFQR